MLDDRTIRRYRDLYLKKGIGGLIENNYKGRQPKLTEHQENELVDHLKENLYSTAGEICKYIEETYNVKFTPDGMVITLHRLGFSYKKTKIVPSKADKEKQEKFVKKYEELKNDLKPNEKVYFMDGVHHYSPNLNLIERLWKLFKKKTLYNKYYNSFLRFKNAVFDFFENCSTRFKNELESLMTEKFHIIES